MPVLDIMLYINYNHYLSNTIIVAHMGYMLLSHIMEYMLLSHIMGYMLLSHINYNYYLSNTITVAHMGYMLLSHINYHHQYSNANYILTIMTN